MGNCVTDWKSRQLKARRRFRAFWQGKDCILWLTAPAEKPAFCVEMPPRPETVEDRWLDLDYVHARQLSNMASTHWAGDSFPMWTACFGPGSLALVLGSRPVFTDETLWYEPCLPEPENFRGTLQADPEGIWWQRHVDLVKKAVSDRDRCGYAVAMPDLIENLDIYASLRGTQKALADLLDFPDFCRQRLAEINRAFFLLFDTLYRIAADEEGGNAWVAFNLWGPGRTAKIQCDLAVGISAGMFRQILLPFFREQCDRLDYILYHLDGQEEFQHLPALLGLQKLNAIQFIPRAGTPGAGCPCWYDLYREIKAAGKRVQLSDTSPDQVLPLLEAVGPEGVFVNCRASSVSEAERIEREVNRLRNRTRRS